MDQESLLDAAPLLQGELLNKRRELKKNLVRYSLTLSRCPDEFEPKDIIKLINSKFSIELDSGVVISGLKELEDEGFVKHTLSSREGVIEQFSYQRAG